MLILRQMKNNKQFNLLIIDAQEDFCNSATGSLYINGAHEDCRRIANFIEENGDNIKSIVLTVDWHSFNHCSFSTTWGKENKIISTPVEQWLNEHPDIPVEELPGIVGDNIVTWPQHCIAYDRGAAIQPLVWKACLSFKVKYPDKKIIVFRKGIDCEEYSAFARNEMGYSFEQMSFLMDKITPLYIMGEAADVCVKNSLSHLLSRYDMGENIIVLKDYMSAVDENFSFENDNVYQRLIENGGKII